MHGAMWTPGTRDSSLNEDVLPIGVAELSHEGKA